MSMDSFVMNDLNDTGIMGQKTGGGTSLLHPNRRPFSLTTKVGSVVGMCVGVIVVLVTGYWAITERMFILSEEHPPILETFSSRLRFTATFWSLPLFWLVINCHLVAMSRLMSQAMNPLSDNEHIVQSVKNVLTNSMEQFLLSAFAQIVLIVHMTGTQVASVIPLINVLHLMGRICFWLFYPRFRSFGFILSFLPTNIALGFGMYMLFAEQVTHFLLFK